MTDLKRYFNEAASLIQLIWMQCFIFFIEWICDRVRVWAHSCVVSVVSLCMYRYLRANVSVHMPGCPCRHQRTILSPTLLETGSPCGFSIVLTNLFNVPEL